MVVTGSELNMAARALLSDSSLPTHIVCKSVMIDDYMPWDPRSLDGGWSCNCRKASKMIRCSTLLLSRFDIFWMV